jgi:hypothetical protein
MNDDGLDQLAQRCDEHVHLRAPDAAYCGARR